jgi:hypothetical protein
MALQRHFDDARPPAPNDPLLKEKTMSDMNDTASFRDYIVQRRATADVAADPAVCALAALAMSGVLPARPSWRVLKSYIEAQAPEQVPGAKRVWDEYFRSTISVHDRHDDDRRVHLALHEWSGQGGFDCLICGPFGGPPTSLPLDDDLMAHDDVDEIAIGDLGRVVLLGAHSIAVCRRCSAISTDQVINAAIARALDDAEPVPASF